MKEKRKCFACKEEKTILDFYKDKQRASGRRYICKRCHKQKSIIRISKNRSQYNAKQYRHIKKYPEKQSARVKLNYALKTGKVKRLTCQVSNCSKQKTQAHHFDYNKPLEVVWLCTEHHANFHHKEV